jgi:rRNA-processing protein FCF1
MEVILDSSFIISCMLARIDFLSDLEEKGFRVVVPREVTQELKDLKIKKGQSHNVRTAVDAVLEMIEQRKVKKMSLGGGKVDDSLIKIGKEGTYIATLDRVIKREVPNRVVILAGKKGIGVERD